MLVIKIEGLSDDDLIGFEVRGHAGYADAGEDIVCAGVSAVLQTAALALEQLFSVKPHLVVKPGHMVCRLPDYHDPMERLRAKTILQTAILGCRNIALQYPNHIQLREGGGSHADD